MTKPSVILPERAQEIIDHLPVAVYRTTPDGRILEGNRAVQDLLGYTVDEFTALRADELYFEPGERGPFLQSRVEGNNVVRTVLRLKRKDGRPVWAEDVGRAITDAAGNVLYFDGTLVDITDQVEAEQALRTSEAMLRTIHEKAPIAIFTLGPDGRVIQANPQAHTMLGLADGALRGKTISEFTFPDDAKESQDAFMRLKNGEVDEVALDKRYRRIDNKAIWGHVRAVAVRNPDGSFSHTISLVQDITRRKRTEDAFRLLDRLTHGINQAGDLEEALKAVLDGICTSIGFSYGEAWLPDDQDVLHISPAWHGEPTRELLKFRHLSEQIAFAGDEGLPGRLFRQEEVLWFEDLAHDQRNIRAGAAAAAGLHCAVGVPVRTGGQAVAVLMFLDPQREQPQEHTLRLVKFLADRLGSTVARRRLEVRLEEQAHIMEAQIEGASEGILVTSGKGDVLGVNRRFLAMCGVEGSTKDESCSSMELFEQERDRDEFMDLVRRFYEDRSLGHAQVEMDKVTYERRSVPLGSGDGGRVWYFARMTDDDAENDDE